MRKIPATRALRPPRSPTDLPLPIAADYTSSMQPNFERGDPERPRGHALVYFRAIGDPEIVLGSYIVVPPITMDLAKYVPAMFAAQMPSLMPSGPSVFPLPPFPERVESLARVRQLAAARGDDLLDGGTVDATDMQRLLMLVADVAGEYARLYTSYAERLPVEEEPGQEALPGVDVDALLMTVMSDAEKVGRLAKLTGTVRYGIEGGDEVLVAETVREMEGVGRHLGEQYRVAELLLAARDPGEHGGRLTELLLQRCYKLAAEEYAALEPLDAEIARLREGT